MQSLTAVFEQKGEWWMAWIEEIPGANTQGATLEEARENLRDAVNELFEARRELAKRQLQGREIIEELSLAA
ncbi:MAG: type II toxin-antitoxin system HicB family antitoxin [Armatimonadetes bacterium]|nr:type II toxin-antitoxin system HicB family antitoxin [Armatimonadota bacterium]